MKNEVRYIAVVYIISLGLLFFRIPIEYLLNDYNFFIAPENELLSNIIIRPVLLVFLFFTINKLRLNRFNGIEAKLILKNLQVLLIPLTIVAMGMMSNWNVYLDAEYRILIIFIVSVLLLGLFEELLFRGIILPLFIKAFGKHKQAIYLGGISSAILFVTHYINLIKEPDNFWGVTNQVFFATSMGIFFAGLLFRTKNIFVLAIFHAMVNFSFGPSILKSETVSHTPNEVVTFMNWQTAIFFIFIALSGVYMIERTNKEEIMSLIDKVKI